MGWAIGICLHVNKHYMKKDEKKKGEMDTAKQGIVFGPSAIKISILSQG